MGCHPPLFFFTPCTIVQNLQSYGTGNSIGVGNTGPGPGPVGSYIEQMLQLNDKNMCATHAVRACVHVRVYIYTVFTISRIYLHYVSYVSSRALEPLPSTHVLK